MDRITILEIKQRNIKTRDKLRHVEAELALLKRVAEDNVRKSPSLEALTNELKEVNEALWKIEDEIRRCEKQAAFGEEFVNLARSVYRQNDRRSAVKHRINTLLGAEIFEEKSYENY